jgi:hypothetical protein
MQHIKPRLAIEEVAQWANYQGGSQEFSVNVLCHLQAFLKLPRNSKESDDEYVERKAILAIVSEQDVRLDSRFELNIFVLLHARKLRQDSALSETALMLPPDFTLKQREYLLSAIEDSLEDYLACVRIIHQLANRYKLNVGPVAKQILAVTTQYLNQYFDAGTHTQDESVNYFRKCLQIIYTFSHLKLDVANDLGENLVRASLQMVAHQEVLEEETKGKILEIGSGLSNFRNLLNKLDKNEICCLITEFQAIFMQKLSEIVHASEETIERIISAVYDLAPAHLSEQFTLGLITEFGTIPDMRSCSESLFKNVFSRLKQERILDHDKKEHYLFVMEKIRYIILNIEQNREDTITPDFSDTFYLNYLALADALLLHDEYRAEVLEEMTDFLTFFQVPTKGKHGDACFTELLTRGADPTANAPDTLVLGLISSKNFDRLNLLLNCFLNHATSIDLNKGCGQSNLMRLALKHGAKAKTIRLMLDCQFPVPKGDLTQDCKDINLEALGLLYAHVSGSEHTDPDLGKEYQFN